MFEGQCFRKRYLVISVSFRVEEFMKTISDNCPLASLTPMPVRRMPRSTPLKRSLSDKVRFFYSEQLHRPPRACIVSKITELTNLLDLFYLIPSSCTFALFDGSFESE